MAIAQTLRHALTVGFITAGLTLSIAGPAAADTTPVPHDVVIVSSTQVATGTFTMTATNVSDDGAITLELSAPGDASNVIVDVGSYLESWVIEMLQPGATATMSGVLKL